MALPHAFLTHLREQGYHPRSDKHSNALCLAVLEALLEACPALKRSAAAGEIAFNLNVDLRFATSSWNVDLALGAVSDHTLPADGRIRRSTPDFTQIALEVKGVMTEHRKAVLNRKRDLEAHHGHVHSYNPQAIAAAMLVVNVSETFRSPLRTAVTNHGDRTAVRGIVDYCVTQMRNVQSATRAGGDGMDAKAVLVVDMDNIDLGRTAYMTQAPAPQPGDFLHYDSFIQRICQEYTSRFAR